MFLHRLLATLICTLTPFASFASPFTRFAGDYNSVNWTCRNPEHWFNNVRTVRITSESGIDRIYMNACARGDDCEGRMPSEEFSLDDTASYEYGATGKVNRGSYQYFFRIDQQDSRSPIKLFAVMSTPETPYLDCVATIWKTSTKR